MSEFRKITTGLAGQLGSVAAGDYPYTNEMVGQAIRDGLAKPEARQRDIARLRQLREVRWRSRLFA
jgi:hypothetical protein